MPNEEFIATYKVHPIRYMQTTYLDEFTQIFTDSVEPNVLTTFIKSISNSFDELNLYPYISGHEKAFEKDIIKAILEHYKEGKSYDEICKEKMKNERFFYAVVDAPVDLSRLERRRLPL